MSENKEIDITISGAEASKVYWEDHMSHGATLEAMMLDSKAKFLDEADRTEMLSLIPSIEGNAVLELGAGIGRYTAALATAGKSVLAVDFIESAIEQNRAVNGHIESCSFLAHDATKLELEDESFDLVFSNWLLMYLNDEEVEALLSKALLWLKGNGVLVFRESCFHQSGKEELHYF